MNVGRPILLRFDGRFRGSIALSNDRSQRRRRTSLLAELRYTVRNVGERIALAEIKSAEAWLIGKLNKAQEPADDIAWTDDAALGLSKVDRFQPGERKQFRLPIPLRKSIDRLSDDRLWTWKYRVTVEVRGDPTADQIETIQKSCDL